MDLIYNHLAPLVFGDLFLHLVYQTIARVRANDSAAVWFRDGDTE